MKILKLIKTFFLNIWKVIDKIIVFPITKFIYKITSGFTNSSKKVENWLSNANTLLFISLFLAIATFIIIDQKIIIFNDNTVYPVEIKKSANPGKAAIKNFDVVKKFGCTVGNGIVLCMMENSQSGVSIVCS